MKQSRKSMRAGRMFAFDVGGLWPWDRGSHDVLVVVDSGSEVGFWRGGAYRVGEIAPHSHFTVVA